MTRAPQRRPPLTPARRRAWDVRPADALVIGSAIVVGVVAAVQLAIQAHSGVFGSDECFHAAAAQTIHHTHALPDTFPQFYSGFYYYYQPLFHIVGAMWIALLGVDALHVLPPVLFAALLALLLARPLGPGSALAGAWAALACLASGPLLQYATLLYAEGLVTLLAAATIAAFAAVIRNPTWTRAVLLGVLAGAGMLTKFNAWVLLAPAVAGAAIAAVRGRRDLARALALAVVVAILVPLPHLIRNQRLFGSALYPAFAPDLDRALYALNHDRFSAKPLEFYARLPDSFGWPLLALVLAAIAAVAMRRKLEWRSGVLGVALLGIVMVPLVPFGAERHLNPFLAVAALVSASIVTEALAARRGWLVAAGLALAAVAAARIASLENQHFRQEIPLVWREAFPEVAKRTPPGALILSLPTYDTAFFTGRRATWPIPWGQRTHPVEMFTERDPDRFLEQLRRHRIDYVLLPTGINPAPWNSANYPESFAVTANELIRARRLQLVWGSDFIFLVRVPPGPATRPGAGPNDPGAGPPGPGPQ